MTDVAPEGARRVHDRTTGREGVVNGMRSSMGVFLGVVLLGLTGAPAAQAAEIVLGPPVDVGALSLIHI